MQLSVLDIHRSISLVQKSMSNVLFHDETIK